MQHKLAKLLATGLPLALALLITVLGFGVLAAQAAELSPPADQSPALPALPDSPSPVILPVLTYTFDLNNQEWLIYGDANGGSITPDHMAQPSHALIGGNPGGFLYATDDVTGDTWYWVKSYLQPVDISEAYGKALSFDLRQNKPDNQYREPAGDIRLYTGAPVPTTLIYYLPFNPRLSWTSYSIALDESARWWVTKPPAYILHRASKEDIEFVLSNLRQVVIRGEYRDGSDVGSLDNVRIGAAPKPTWGGIVLPGSGGSIVFTTSTHTRLDFPPGMLGEPFTVTVELTETGTLTHVTNISGTLLPPGHSFGSVGAAFIIRAQNHLGSGLFQFQKPFTLTIHFTDEEVAELQAGSLLIYYQQEGEEVWHPIETGLVGNILTGHINHLTKFAVLGEPVYKIYLPLVMKN